MPGSCGTGGCEYEVYINDQLAGQVAGHCPFTTEPRTDEVDDIMATWRLGANETEVTRYWFKGDKYRERSDMHCTGNACGAEHWIHH